MTLDDANALLHRMAWGWNPWPGLGQGKCCGYCGGERYVHRTTGFLSNAPIPPCPLRPLDDVAELPARLRTAEWTGAGCCMACHAMLPPRDVPNARVHHKLGCAVARFLNDAETSVDTSERPR